LRERFLQQAFRSYVLHYPLPCHGHSSRLVLHLYHLRKHYKPSKYLQLRDALLNVNSLHVLIKVDNVLQKNRYAP
jgi:hypothetical protein